MKNATFDLDNDGSGFDVEDDDLIEILADASNKSENEDVDSASINEFGVESSPVVANPSGEPIRREPPRPVASEVPSRPASVSEETKPVPTVETVKNTEVALTGSERTVRPVVNKGSSLDIDTLRRVLNVLATYRDLPQTHREIVSKFVSNGNVIPDEAELVLAVLESDDTLARTMKNLKVAKDFEPVDRSFFVMELSESQLNELGELVSVFNPVDFNRSYPRHKNGKNIVRAVEELTPEMMGYVDSTERVLSAAHGES